MSEQIDLPKLRYFLERRAGVHARVQALTDEYMPLRDAYHFAVTRYKNSRHLKPEVENLSRQLEQLQEQRERASEQFDALAFVDAMAAYARRLGYHVDEVRATAYRPYEPETEGGEE